MSNGFESARAQELTQAIVASFESNAAAVVCFSLQASLADIGELSSVLSSDEIARRDRFRVPGIGQRFVICRGRLRLMLAALLGVRPTEIRFQMGAWGKPYLSRDHGLPLQFNVSHSASVACIAFAKDHLIGVDLEQIQNIANASVLAAEVLSAQEKINWEQLTADRQRVALLKTWVGKESLLKGLGIGVAGHMKDIELGYQIGIEQASCVINEGIARLAASDPLSGISANARLEKWSISWSKMLPHHSLAIAQPSNKNNFTIHSW